jgi:hypothetical protein
LHIQSREAKDTHTDTVRSTVDDHLRLTRTTAEKQSLLYEHLYMGGKLVIPEADANITKVIRAFQFTPQDISDFWKIFQK